MVAIIGAITFSMVIILSVLIICELPLRELWRLFYGKIYRDFK